MKLNKLFLLTAMGLGFFACSDDNNLDNNISGNESQKGDAYAAISLDFSNMSARALETPDLEGSDEERAIKSLYVMIADADEKIEEVWGGNVTNLTNNTLTDGSKYYDADKTITFKTSAGTKKVYVVVNQNEEPTKGGAIDTYLKTLKTNLNAGSLTTGFLMTGKSATDIIVPSGQTEEVAKSQPAPIIVERAVAKVTVTCNEDSYIIADGGTAVVVDGETKRIGGDLSEVKYDFEGGVQDGYRWNPGHLLLTTSATNRGYSVAANSIAVSSQPATASAVYCLENLEEAPTGDNAKYAESKATYFVVQAKYIPGKVVDISKTSETEADVKDIATNASAASFYYVTAGKLKGEYLLKTDLETWQNPTSNNTREYPYGVEAISGEYIDGKCWFGPVWIGEGNGTVGSCTDIYRNKWYNYDITSFTLPGKTTKPGPGNPTSYMGIDILAADWEYTTSSVPIN